MPVPSAGFDRSNSDIMSVLPRVVEQVSMQGRLFYAEIP